MEEAARAVERAARLLAFEQAGASDARRIQLGVWRRGLTHQVALLRAELGS